MNTWYETRVGDSVEPQVKNEGWLAYDDKYFYAGFRFEDPHPELIRAPLADHDQLSGSTDYGGVLLDSRNDGKTAILFLANANGLLYDAVTNDASGEDSSPDYYWESAGKITATGWNLELRIPFSSLRYDRSAEPTWGILLYRNYPRDRHYQFFSARLPRDVSCFICNESKLTGLANLPHGSHLVVAPYASAQRLDAPTADLGSPLAEGDVDSEFGIDVKWSPLANLAIDATINPDFSQVEADAAQIGANERFALFYPEKRSFFLEGIDLFSTPFQAVYTRSVTSPSAGLRATGQLGRTAFTALATRDRGDGLVILPGPEGSDAAEQDFESDVGVIRLRHDLGASFVSALATGRVIEGGGHNAVFGPDFNWRPRPTDAIAGQALWSSSETPNRTDLASQWDGRSLSDRALLLRWSHNTPKVDWFLQGQDLGPDFRADEGFMPQVGYREGYFEAGYTVRPAKAFFNRIRMFTIDWYDEDYDGSVLSKRLSIGAGMDGKLSSFVRVELNHDEFKVGDETLSRFRPYVTIQASPGRVLNSVSVEAFVGEEIDFANGREANGTTLIGSMTVRPTDHLAMSASASARWLNVDDASLGSGRLFLAQVERLRASYQFNSRSFVRLIGQYVQTTRDPSLYTFTVDSKEADFSLSGLFAYKLNWQTVFYLGYGDERAFAAFTDRLEPSARQAFAKVSYALQR
ncbi:MAG: carbohydrate binding family 9 domain-containing protein [Candidatus Eisenbacteria bacterium]|uniref:Carbohydrate binding family 9 domain-containing protein n=1 Tax=Eiseniibacteriota bacterium TaxID=2212470 RepID=A0A849SH45_UNCEI|nr:carbohydrate binding family 9 domain-containing protein [Candidatus Eisenbacteria bacterium]